MSWAKISVVGGINLDVLGMPAGPYVPRDSLQGTVRFRPGGVGRNIAAQAARLGADVTLYAPLGNDHSAGLLYEGCLADGIRLAEGLRFEGPSQVYLAVHDQSGDMISAINDMALMDRLTPQVLTPLLPEISSAQVCVADCNLPESTLSWLAEALNIPLVLDPVSMQKAKKAEAVYDRLSAFKPNLYEARFLSCKEAPEDCVRFFLDAGVRRVFLSMGAQGVLYGDASGLGTLVPERVSLSPQTGAGDAMTAGIAVALAGGLDTAACARAGMRAALRHLTGPANPAHGETSV